MFDWNLRAGSNVQNITGIIQKLLNKSAVAQEKNIQWNIPAYADVCYVFVPLLTEYSWNILHDETVPLEDNQVKTFRL